MVARLFTTDRQHVPQHSHRNTQRLARVERNECLVTNTIGYNETCVFKIG